MNCLCTWSVRKVSDRIFLCEHLMDFSRLSIASVAGKQQLSEEVCSACVGFSLQGK